MKKITEKYYLGSNKYSFILYERKVSETTQKEMYKNLGYFKSLEDVYTALIGKDIKDDLNVLDNMNKINKLVEELKEFTIKHIGSKSYRIVE